MSESPSTTGRRTRRARRVSLEAFDAMQRESSGRVRADNVLVADPDPGADVDLRDQDPSVPSTGTLRTDANVRNDLEPPAEAQFAGKDFLPAPGVRRVAQALIARDNRLRHLDGLRIEFLWKRRGGSARGNPKTGDAVLPAGLSRHAFNQMAIRQTGNATERVAFVVWLAADHVSEYSPLACEATLYHQLLKCGLNPRDHSEFRLRAPLAFFVEEIERYGLWQQSLRDLGQAARVARSADGTTSDQPQLALEEDTGSGADDNDPWETTSVEIPEHTTNGAAQS